MWSDLTQCDVRSVEHRPPERRGVLHMPPDTCCDMCGCIALFEGIDPNVALIETFAGGERDTAYVRRPTTGWEAISPGGGAWGCFVAAGESRAVVNRQ